MCYTSKAGMQEFRGCVPLETTWDKKYEKSRVEMDLSGVLLNFTIEK